MTIETTIDQTADKVRAASKQWKGTAKPDGNDQLPIGDSSEVVFDHHGFGSLHIMVKAAGADTIKVYACNGDGTIVDTTTPLAEQAFASADEQLMVMDDAYTGDGFIIEATVDDHEYFIVQR